jgi:predicted nucleic acid-binding protein
MILDTCFIIDLMAKDSDAISKLSEMETESTRQRISTMTLFELYVGVGQVDRNEEKIDEIRGIISDISTCPANEKVMKTAGRVCGELKKSGYDVGEADTIIAATGITKGEPVLTRNTRHFNRIPDTDVCEY